MINEFGSGSPDHTNLLPPQSATTPETGPGAWLMRLCVKFDRLFSFDHSDARQAKADYDEAFHDAVHALKDLRQFAASIAPTWTAATRAAPPSLPRPEPELTMKPTAKFARIFDLLSLRDPTLNATLYEEPEFSGLVADIYVALYRTPPFEPPDPELKRLLAEARQTVRPYVDEALEAERKTRGLRLD